MDNLMIALIIVNVLVHLLTSVRKFYYSSTLLIGCFIIIFMSVLGIESGKLIISVIIIFISWLLFASKDEAIFRSKSNTIAALILFSFYFYFMSTYLFSPANSASYGIWKLRQFTVLAFLPSFSLLMFGKITKREIELIERMVLLSAVILALFIFNEFLSTGISSLNSGWFVRISVGNINVNWLSRFLGLSLVILNSKRNSISTFLLVVINIILLIASILTGSKTTLFFVIPIIIFMYFDNPMRKQNYLKNLLVIVILITSIVSFLGLFTPEAIIRRFSLTDGTSIARLDMYNTTLESYTRGNIFNMIFGNGGATIGASLGETYGRFYPHNLLLEILYELGLLGIMLFLISAIYVIVNAITKKRNWVYYAYILFLLYAMTSGDLASNEWVFIMFSFYLITVQGNNRNHIYYDNGRS